MFRESVGPAAVNGEAQIVSEIPLANSRNFTVAQLSARAAP
jgi:hypothetical protein